MLSQTFREGLRRPAHDVAPELLGGLLRANVGGAVVAIRITEVEAYGGAGHDPASHAYRGMTPRTTVMFGPAGYFYVYFTYGTHWCLNIVTGDEGEAGAALVRAGRVVEGIDVARTRRPRAQTDRDLARGPARLTSALGIDGSFNGRSIDDAELTFRPPDRVTKDVMVGPRVGITSAVDWPWRFWLPDDDTVSAYRPGVKRSRT